MAEPAEERGKKRYSSTEEIERDFFPELAEAKRIVLDRHPGEVAEVHSDLLRKKADRRNSNREAAVE